MPTFDEVYEKADYYARYVINSAAHRAAEGIVRDVVDVLSGYADRYEKAARDDKATARKIFAEKYVEFSQERPLKTITITRASVTGDGYEVYCIVDPLDETGWPKDMPNDIADLIRTGETENNTKHGSDGYHYRLILD